MRRVRSSEGRRLVGGEKSLDSLPAEALSYVVRSSTERRYSRYTRQLGQLTSLERSHAEPRPGQSYPLLGAELGMISNHGPCVSRGTCHTFETSQQALSLHLDRPDSCRVRTALIVCWACWATYQATYPFHRTSKRCRKGQAVST